MLRSVENMDLFLSAVCLLGLAYLFFRNGLTSSTPK